MNLWIYAGYDYENFRVTFVVLTLEPRAIDFFDCSDIFEFKSFRWKALIMNF